MFRRAHTAVNTRIAATSVAGTRRHIALNTVTDASNPAVREQLIRKYDGMPVCVFVVGTLSAGLMLRAYLEHGGPNRDRGATYWFQRFVLCRSNWYTGPQMLNK